MAYFFCKCFLRKHFQIFFFRDKTTHIRLQQSSPGFSGQSFCLCLHHFSYPYPNHIPNTWSIYPNTYKTIFSLTKSFALRWKWYWKRQFLCSRIYLYYFLSLQYSSSLNTSVYRNLHKDRDLQIRICALLVLIHVNQTDYTTNWREKI